MLLLVFAAPGLARAEPSPFDLAGPTLRVSVTDAGRTLPIAEVPNLKAGEVLSIKAELPPDQSAHYLLVAAFLRGATNPPPKAWFYKSETWKDARGLKIAIPDGAQQALILLAPQTGGDFSTLIGAVRGRPGAFVRASQDLSQATLDRTRLDAYLAAVRRIDRTDPAALKTASPLLARSLAIKLNAACLDKTPALRAACLTQGGESLILDDGHGDSIAQALTSGLPANLAEQLASTPQAGFGYYSAYIASVMDIVRLLDSLHTAHYQYIPALADQRGDRLALQLNAPPSFYDPKSVLVAALPAIAPAQVPPLHPADPDGAYCAEKPDLLLPAEGAPLVFSTGYAHDLVLRLKTSAGEPVELPVSADAEKGGFVVDTAGLGAADIGDTAQAVLHGQWGFEPYDGPQYRLHGAVSRHWRLPADAPPLIVGADREVRLEAMDGACVESIALKPASGDAQPVAWKSSPPDGVTVTLPLKTASPGPLTLLVSAYGSKAPEQVSLQALAAAGRFDGFVVHAGDAYGVLKGGGLGEVRRVSLGGVDYAPDPAAATGADRLSMTATDAKAAAALKPGAALTAKIALADGRVLSLDTIVQPPRPGVVLISKSIQPAASGPDVGGRIALADPDEAPRGARLVFSIRAQAPAAFSPGDKVEVATADGAFSTVLSLKDGLVLEDSGVAVATLDTAAAFDASAAGPLRFRLLDGDVAGDWTPLATLVRLPSLAGLSCPGGAAEACQLTGSDLFLLDSVSSNAAFDHPVQVPDGFPGDALSVPHPAAGRLFVRLRDDPKAVDPVTFPRKKAAEPPAGR
ncbi:MAG TPA: hypothetical protein VHZ26_03590 [Caulobacteraceae bacterium]|nr:hypothetical protein [Caulobacteraceae bacterium]